MFQSRGTADGDRFWSSLLDIGRHRKELVHEGLAECPEILAGVGAGRRIPELVKHHLFTTWCPQFEPPVRHIHNL